MRSEHLYIVTYDISDQKRWRRVFRIMKGFGSWLQFSVFQCRMDTCRRQQLIAALDEVINHRKDHILLIKLGPVEKIKPSITSLGKDYHLLERETIIV